MFFKKDRSESPFWAQLGPIWVDFGDRNGSQKQPKSEPRRNKKREEKRIEKNKLRIDLGAKNVTGGKSGRVSYKAGGGGRGDQDEPKRLQEGLKTCQDDDFCSKT